MKLFTVHEVLKSKQEQLVQVKAERDALVVMIESLIKAIKAIENDCIECSYDDESGYFIGNDAMSNACELAHYVTTQQALAEIRAEAGRAGYLQGHLDAGGDYGKLHKKLSGYYADKYAKKIRQGGAA